MHCTHIIDVYYNIEDSGYLVRSVTSQLELLLSLHTSLVEKKPSFVHQELVMKPGRQWWSENHARTFEQSIFSESHTTKTLKMP